MNVKRIIRCVFLTLALILAGSFVPVIGFICLMICPVPLAVLGCLDGHKSSGIAELLIEATLFLTFSPSMAVYFLLGCAPVSGVIFMLSREEFKEVKKYSGAETLLICAGLSLLMKVILLVVFWLFTGRNILFPDVAQMQAVMTQLYGDNPALLESVSKVLAIFPYILPAMLVIYVGIEIYLNYSIIHSVLRRFFPKSKNFPPELPEFKFWRFPASLMPALVFALILGYFIDSETWLAGSVFVMNLQIILNVFMFIQGLALTFWLMAGFRLRRITKSFICVILAFPFFWPWLIIMGMCDMVLNMRERIKFSG